jgi:hypothetical protein
MDSTGLSSKMKKSKIGPKYDVRYYTLEIQSPGAKDVLRGDVTPKENTVFFLDRQTTEATEQTLEGQIRYSGPSMTAGIYFIDTKTGGGKQKHAREGRNGWIAFWSGGTSGPGTVEMDGNVPRLSH